MALAEAIEGHDRYAGMIGITPRGINLALHKMGFGVLPQDTKHTLRDINNSYAKKAFSEYEQWKKNKQKPPGKRKFMSSIT